MKTTSQQLRELQHGFGYFAPRPPPHFWVGGDGDCSPDYCEACCQEAVEEERALNPAGEFWVDGGGEAHEEDHPAYCSTCGKLTSYQLTDYGVDAELDHFEAFEADPIEPLAEEVAYEALSIVDGICSDDEERATRAVAVLTPLLAILKAHDPYVWREAA